MNGKFVLAKHDGVDKEYCFAVPDGMDINIGDKLLVETCRGNQVVTATSTELFSSQYDQIVKRFGATIPLKRVLQCCGKEMQNYLQKQAENAIISDIMAVRQFRQCLHRSPHLSRRAPQLDRTCRRQDRTEMVVVGRRLGTC